MRAGVAVPVPGATHVAAGIDQAEIGDPRLCQAGASAQPGKPAANHGKTHMIGDRRAFLAWRVGIAQHLREMRCQPHILRIAFGAQALVPL